MSTGAGHVPTFSGFFGEGTRDERRKARKGRREPDLLSLRIRLFETNFLGPQGCLNKKHTCGEPTAGVAHTFPGGIQGPGRGVTAHQRAPPEKATGPARLAHPGFGLEHPGNRYGNGPKTGKSLNGDVRALPSSKPAQYAKQCQKHQNNPTPTLSTKTRGVRRKSELGLYKFGPYGPVGP